MQAQSPSTSASRRLAGIIGQRLMGWKPLLASEPALLGFLTLNVFSFNLMVAMNLARAGVQSRLVLAVLLFVLATIFYGGIALTMVFVAHTTTERMPPTCRRPRLELALLTAYFAFLFLGGYHLDRWHFRHPLARAVREISHNMNVADGLAMRSLGIQPTRQRLEMLRNWHFFFVVPFLVMLLCGNRVRNMGFRRPLSAPWTLAVWAALPVINLACDGVGVVPGLLATVTAMIGPGLAEELAFRAGLQSRVELASRKPITALVLSALVFAVIHLNAWNPDPVWAIANAMGPKAMVGFLLGYLWYRTRSLLPGVVLHGVLDAAFFASR